MTGPTEGLPPPLEPLRAALLANARAEAERIVANAREEADRVVAAATAEADARVARAREQGEADARALLRLERSRLERQNRGVVLSAQSHAFQELVRQAQDAVRAALAEPDGRARLEAALLERLGPTATVRGAATGGLVGRSAGGVTVNASVEALVESALAGLDLEPLWTAAG